MSRLAKGSTTLFSLVTLVLASIIVWRVLPQQPPAIDPTDLRAALIRAGLGADALAAVGCSAQQASTVVADAKAEIVAHPTRLSEDDTSCASARVTADALGKKIQAGLASQEEIGSYAAATSALESEQNERQAAVDAIFTAGCASLSQGQVALLTKIQGNRARHLEVELLTVDRTTEEWVALRDALDNERVNAQSGEETSPAASTILTTARENQTVADAKASCVANLATLTTAWINATAGN